MIRLVATDLDGTIVRSDGSISQRTSDALAAVERMGLRLVLVTGRPPRWMHRVVEATGHRGLAICANGAYVYDLHAERIVDQFLLQPDAATEAVRRMRRLVPDAAFAVEREDGFAREPAYRPRWPVPDDDVRPILDLVHEPVAKLLVRDETSTGDAMLQLIRPVLHGLVDVTHSNVNDCLLEVSAPGVSKASTLAHLASRWHVQPHQVVAFGDMPNDVPMLRWAGTSYAVANAHAEVLDVVHHVTSDVDDDGVAFVLEQLLSEFSERSGPRTA